MKIYTRTGDAGTTSLFGGQRVDKGSSRIASYGAVDELNSMLGVIIVIVKQTLKGQGGISNKLLRVQKELFVLGGDLATPITVKVKVPRVKKPFITKLEKEIDLWQKSLPPLKNFILPGGSNAGSSLHVARAICRRVERSVADLASREKINQYDLMYVNRLSDWLFVAARYINNMEAIPEIPWKGRR